MPSPISLVFKFRPRIQTQEEAWKIYSHFKDALGDGSVSLLDFKIPRTTYYGSWSYMNQVQLRVGLNGQESQHKLGLFKSNPPDFDVYRFRLKEDHQ